jgi:uncharacterized membrane protein YhaH (DUF805 family)
MKGRIWQAVLMLIYLVVVLPVTCVHAMGKLDTVWKGIILLICTLPVAILTLKWDKEDE